MFLQVSVILSMGGGACLVAEGAWLLGGMHGCQGACMVAGGHAWLWGGHAWLPGGVHGCWGACIGYDEIRSMSGQYASYWNTFLLPEPNDVVESNRVQPVILVTS